MKLVIGCPVRDRAWILEDWFDHIERACDTTGITPEFAFIAGASYDNTDRIIKRRTRGKNLHFVKISDPGLPPGAQHRSWGPERMRFMVEVRNDLLQLVRNESPDLFLSLDSDILIHQDLIKNLVESVENYDAVAGKTYLHAHEKTMNYGNWIGPDPRMRRGQDRTGVFKAGIIMAIKLMTENAYNIDYEYHFYGEDLGWSWACKRAGLALGVDGNNINKHCLNPQMLYRVDPRIGL
jgi:hypothetical protein